MINKSIQYFSFKLKLIWDIIFDNFFFHCVLDECKWLYSKCISNSKCDERLDSRNNCLSLKPCSIFSIFCSSKSWCEPILVSVNIIYWDDFSDLSHVSVYMLQREILDHAFLNHLMISIRDKIVFYPMLASRQWDVICSILTSEEIIRNWFKEWQYFYVDRCQLPAYVYNLKWLLFQGKDS